jgi:folylpolyglutamate synthase
VGLYTSPHLRSVRERIQINNEPLSEPLFSKYFFDMWDRLSATGDGSKPVYFRFLTLVAFHAFLQEQVDTAVIECGIGGEYDSTNFLVSPIVTAVTALGIDHVGMLGGTIAEIAWHKAGIFKKGASAFTVAQPKPAMDVLHKRAKERDTELRLVERHPQIASGEVKLGLAADFQKSNASLAVAVAAAHLRALGHDFVPNPSDINKQELPVEFRRGLEQVKLPGRCEMRHEVGNRIAWCLDGGHTLESVEAAVRWFAEEVQTLQQSNAGSRHHSQQPRILIFNQQTRDAIGLACALFTTLSTVLRVKPFTHVIFTTNVTFKDAGYKPDLVAMNSSTEEVQALKVQKELAAIWAELDPAADIKITATIEDAVNDVRIVARQANTKETNEETIVFITGSLHLVGGALEILETGGIK